MIVLNTNDTEVFLFGKRGKKDLIKVISITIIGVILVLLVPFLFQYLPDF
ncbi:hypothetical protein bcere0022_9840 [Bacillus cereus Rock3-44]|nr:hypothetical protein bcere0022_9840 [Bacillus cereus Rock3-44]